MHAGRVRGLRHDKGNAGRGGTGQRPSRCLPRAQVNEGPSRPDAPDDKHAEALIGIRGRWRIGIQDLEDYISDAYRRTAERIAAGELADDVPEGE
jgi:hypothetical protein